MTAAVLVAILLTRLPTLSNPLTEAHAFRQTQTAWASLLFSQQGIDLLHPQMPVFGPPFVMPLEFPLFQALASLLISVGGLGPDLADRLLAVFCFGAATIAVYRLGIRLSGRFVAVVATICFAFSPFALMWSRASLIEFMAVALSLWGLETSLAAIMAHGRKRWLLALLGAVLGSAALAVKVTTGVFWLLPLFLVLLMRRELFRSLGERLLLGAILLLIPAMVGGLWLEVSQQIRQQNLFAYAQNDQLAISWYFGSLAQRLDPGTWSTIIGRVWMEIGGLCLPLLLLLAWSERRHLSQGWQKTVWVGLGGVALAAPLVLVNVYFIHDYYLAAISPVIALFLGLGGLGIRRHWAKMWARMLAGTAGLAGLFVLATGCGLGGMAIISGLLLGLGLVLFFFWARWRGRSRASRMALLASGLLLPLLAIAATLGMISTGGANYVSRAYFPPPDVQAPVAAQIDALVPADHWVALIVLGPYADFWDPSYFYYAHRQGLMIGPLTRSLGALKVACADPRYVLLSMSAQYVVSRAACPDGAAIP